MLRNFLTTALLAALSFMALVVAPADAGAAWLKITPKSCAVRPQTDGTNFAAGGFTSDPALKLNTSLMTDMGGLMATCSVHLPDGAEVTRLRIRMVAHPNYSAAHVGVTLYRHTWDNYTDEMAFCTTNTYNTTYVDDTSISYATINSGNNEYYIDIGLSWLTSGAPAATPSVRMIEIEYTL